MRALCTVLRVGALIVAVSVIQSTISADDVPPHVPLRLERDLDLGQSDVPLAAIIIDGNREITTDEILKLIKSRAGQLADAQQIKEDVRTLHSKRWFVDIDTRITRTKQGPALLFRVQERPLLKGITYRGNRQIAVNNLKAIAEQLELKVGDGYDVAINREAARLIGEHYRDRGYAYAQVELERGDLPDDREVVFKIDEGPAVFVCQVNFVGNKSIPTDALNSQLKTSPRNRWFEDGKFVASVIADDKYALTHYYQDRSFFDVQVQHREVAGKDRAQMQIEFVIDEGVPYKIREIEFTGNTILVEKALRNCVALRSGQLYNKRTVDAGKEMMLTQYAQRGHVFATVESKVRSFEEPGYVDLIYEIEEGNRFPVRKAEEFVPDDRAPTKTPSNSAAPTANPKANPKAKTTSEILGVRDLDRIEFSGVDSFEVADIRRSLAMDFETSLAANSNGSLSDFIKVLQRQLLSGLLHSGCPDAQVVAEYQPQQERIAVRISKGPRYCCGEIEVAAGATHVAPEPLIRALTTDPKPRLILWNKGQSAPFDEFTFKKIRERLVRELAIAGFFSPQVEIEVGRNPDSQTAVLKVAIKDVGRRATVGSIDVVGTKRDSVNDVLNYLELQLGVPFDSALPQRLQRRLRESGRYLGAYVMAKSGDPPQAASDPEVRNLQIKLREYKAVPALTQALSPGEEALLKMREWLDRWAKGDVDEDLILAVSGVRLRDFLPGANVTIRMVVAPDRGQTIVFDAKGSDGHPILNLMFVVYPDRTVLAAPLCKAKIEFPNCDGQRLSISANGTSSGARDEPFAFNLGISVIARSNLKASAFGVKPDFSPAFMMSIAHDTSSQYTVKNDVCQISSELYQLQIDMASGRPIDFRYQDKSDDLTVSIRAEKNALKSELNGLEEPLAAAALAYDGASPWKSLLEFSLDCWLDAADREGLKDQSESVRALRKIAAHWSPPAFAEILGTWEWSSNGPDDAFVIPSVHAGFDVEQLAMPRSLSRKNLVGGFILPFLREFVPQSSWAWAISRDAALYWASQDERLGRDLAQACGARDTGPIGDLLLGCVGPYLGLDLREPAGISGMQNLSLEAFRKEYRPFIQGNSWLSRWFVSLASAVRTLDKSDVIALARFLPANAPREPLLQALLELKGDSKLPVERVLPMVLDHLWADLLKTEIATGVRHFVEGAVRDRTLTERGNHIRPASAEEPAGAR